MPIVVYTLLRLGLYALLFLLFHFLGVGTLLAAIFAAVASFALSYVLLQRFRVSAMESLTRKRSGVPVAGSPSPRPGKRPADANAEDAQIDQGWEGRGNP